MRSRGEGEIIDSEKLEAWPLSGSEITFLALPGLAKKASG